MKKVALALMSLSLTAINVSVHVFKSAKGALPLSRESRSRP